MKKILIIMAGFFPGKNYGGPPVSIDNFCSMMDEYKVYIVTTDHDLGDKERYRDIFHGWNDRGNCKVIYLADKDYRYRTFYNICKKLSPDWIYLQGLFQSCIIPGLFLAKVQKRRLLLATRGELCEGAFKKKWKKLPYIAFLRILRLLSGVEFQATSEEENEAIKRRLGIKQECVHYLPNVPTLYTAAKSPNTKVVGKANMVFISRIVPKKNLLYALKRLKSNIKEITFDIYGTIEDEKYWDACQKAIEMLPQNINVNYCGILEHDQVMETFQKYDAFLFPTLSENYGHVIVEALQSGCPVIMSDQTPWRDLEKYESGWDIALKNEKAYEDAINSIADADFIKMEKIRQAAREYINSKLEVEKIKEAYRNVFESI